MTKTVTINIEDDIADRFRKSVAAVYGKGKGTLSRAITEAISFWLEKKEMADEAKTLAFLKNGIPMGKIAYKTRDELHER